MTTLNDDGFIIDPQDLSSITPSSNDDNRVFHHDGTSTLTLTDGSTTAKRGWYIWRNVDTAWYPMGEHADLVDGYHGADLAALAENETVSGSWTFNTKPSVADPWTEDDLNFQEVPLSIPVTKWADGLTNEEIHRIELAAGQSLEVHRLDVQLKGGGSLATPSNLTVDVYDETNSTILASDSAEGTASTGNPIGTSGSGATVLVRISNSSGSYQNAGIGGRLHIV